MLDKIRTCYPGRIISFDKDKQTATVIMAMERVFSNLEAYYKTAPRTIIEDVPVYVTEAGDYSITVPVKEGDDCLIWFAHRGYDHWLYDGKYEAGLDDQARELRQRGMNAPSWHDMVMLIGEYMDVKQGPCRWT